jgi:hypothetical protein
MASRAFAEGVTSGDTAAELPPDPDRSPKDHDEPVAKVLR